MIINYAIKTQVITAMITKVKPEEAGFSSPRLAAVNQLINRYIKTGLIPGAIAVIARHGNLVHFTAYGEMDLEQHKPMREEAIFRIYSMTKPLTAVALLILYEQGYFQLSDPISQYIPAFKNLKVLENNLQVSLKREVTIHDLLLHTAGFSHSLHDSPVGGLYRAASLGNIYAEDDLKGFIQKLVQFPLAFQPGTHWHYSLSYLVLSHLIEILSDMPLDEWITRKVTTPLGMLDTNFHVPKHKLSRLAVLYTHHASTLHNPDKRNAKKNFTLHRMKETDDVLSPPKLLSGSGGMLSTATDYLRFCQMLLNGGELEGNRILSRKTIELMTSQHLPSNLSLIGLHARHEMGLSGIGYGLGVGIMLDPTQAQVLGSKGDYFWSGLANTSFFVDPKEQLIGLFLTQVKSATSIYSFQRDFRVAVYQALI